MKFIDCTNSRIFDRVEGQNIGVSFNNRLNEIMTITKVSDDKITLLNLTTNKNELYTMDDLNDQNIQFYQVALYSRKPVIILGIEIKSDMIIKLTGYNTVNKLATRKLEIYSYIPMFDSFDVYIGDRSYLLNSTEIQNSNYAINLDQFTKIEVISNKKEEV